MERQEKGITFSRESKWDLFPVEFHHPIGPLSRRFDEGLWFESIRHHKKPDIIAYAIWRRKGQSNALEALMLEKNGHQINFNRENGFSRVIRITDVRKGEPLKREEVEEFKAAMKSAIDLHPYNEELLKLYREMAGV